MEKYLSFKNYNCLISGWGNSCDQIDTQKYEFCKQLLNILVGAYKPRGGANYKILLI